MKNQKAISMISLVITIVLIIIIASISSYHLKTTIDDAEYKDIKQEMKDVENVVEYAKTQILIGEFFPNDSEFLIKDAELDGKFGNLLKAEEIEHIKNVNASDVKAPYKYYLMNQQRFDSEFGNDYNVSNLRKTREYLVNYMDATVICTYGNQILANKNIIPAPDIEKANFNIVFVPNGNEEWKKAQETVINETHNSVVEIVEMKYLWSKSYTKPAESEFIETFVNGQTIHLNNKTGNDWYLWIEISYKENGREKIKKYSVKSNPFYVDNIPPTAELSVEEINKD